MLIHRTKNFFLYRHLYERIRLNLPHKSLNQHIMGEIRARCFAFEPCNLIAYFFKRWNKILFSLNKVRGGTVHKKKTKCCSIRKHRVKFIYKKSFFSKIFQILYNQADFIFDTIFFSSEIKKKERETRAKN